jgi:uncharacterized membrane protein YedE/YeeE
MSPQLLTSLFGFAIGLVFGAVGQRTNFCAMGAVADIVVFGDWRRMRAWLLAIAVALLGAQGLAAAGLVDLSESIYLSGSLNWAGSIIGGLIFGVGMVLAGGCGSRNLVRLGQGDLGSLLVVLVLAISAYMALHGLTALLRVNLEGLAAVDLAALGLSGQGLDQMLAGSMGIEAGSARLVVALVIALGLLVFCFANSGFRGSPRNITAGLAIGLLVAAGWAATGVAGADDFEPVRLASLTFVAPVGDSLIYLMTFTGSSLSFGVAVVVGVILGAFGAAKAAGQYRLEIADPRPGLAVGLRRDRRRRRAGSASA